MFCATETGDGASGPVPFKVITDVMFTSLSVAMALTYGCLQQPMATNLTNVL